MITTCLVVKWFGFVCHLKTEPLTDQMAAILNRLFSNGRNNSYESTSSKLNHLNREISIQEEDALPPVQWSINLKLSCWKRRKYEFMMTTAQAVVPLPPGNRLP